MNISGHMFFTEQLVDYLFSLPVRAKKVIYLERFSYFDQTGDFGISRVYCTLTSSSSFSL